MLTYGDNDAITIKRPRRSLPLLLQVNWMAVATWMAGLFAACASVAVMAVAVAGWVIGS